MTHSEKLQTQRVSIIVTKRCTLKCKLCGALAPYIESYHPTIDFLKSEVDAFFRIVDQTGIIDISGGEPLMRGLENDFALGEILLYLTDHYSDKFERVRIFTNGTIIPSDKLCEVFKKVSDKKPFSLTIDDYGKHSPNVDQIAKKLSLYGIDYNARDYINDIHCGGWVDLRDISITNNEATAKELFVNCAIPQKLGCCLEILDGIISPCSVAAARYICGKAGKDDNDIVDLFEDPAKAKEKLNTILTAECFTSCFSCNGGMSDDSQRFIPAEQATSTEIDELRSKYCMRL